ncbi:FxsA family protein [Ureibacillus composti]|nr:FxsA family protein [Ureibacillus composti]
MRKIIVSLVAVILAEIATFIIVGNWLGVINTLLLILLTSIVGIYVAKKQGVQSFQNMNQSIANGNPPGVAMIDTFLIFIGGVLLLFPGFLTDLLGFSLLFPITRKWYKPAIYNWIRSRMKNDQVIIINK